MNFKAICAFGLAGLVSVGNAAISFEPVDYVRALWMTTRFYGGQRSGEGPNWLSIGSTYNTSFTKDSYQGTDVSGGWFDCGDHAMFGHTQYWSAYTLAKAYEAFPKGFHDLYNGKTYEDYTGTGIAQANGNGDWNYVYGGKPNGIPDILDELVYEADYVAKAAISSSVFIVQKGDYGYDHSNWISPGEMSQLSIDQGGECTSGGSIDWNTTPPSFNSCSSYGTRLIKADNDQAMASNAAAFLAVMARVLPDTLDFPTRKALYKTKAKVAYDFAVAHPNAQISSQAYPSNANLADDFVSASLEMYALTNETQYLTNAKNSSSGVKRDHNHALNYNNADDVAWYNMAMANAHDSARIILDKYAKYYKDKINSDGISEVGDPTWGTMRYPLGGAFAMALANKASNSTTWDDAIYSNVNYVMGKNKGNRSYITGFAKGMDASPQHPHHRGVFQTTGIVKLELQNSLTVPLKNQSHGSLVGGQGFNSTVFNDETRDYKTMEVCTDYNVGLVGALAYIVSKVAPTTAKLPIYTPSPIPVLPTETASATFSLARSAGIYEFSNANRMPFTVTVYDLRGTKVATLNSSGESVRYSPISTGVFQALVKSGSNSASYRLTGI